MKNGAIKVLSVVAVLAYLIPPHVIPWNYPADDSFFYLQVASNIADGHGSTFNQITRTNGYHPLWMPFCVLAERLSGNDRTMAIHWAILMQQLLGLASAWLLCRMLRLSGVRLVVTALPMLVFFSITRLYLSEAYVNLFFTTALLANCAVILRAPDKARWIHFGGAGLFAGLAVLARLDNVFMSACVLGVMLLFYGAYAGGVFSGKTVAAALLVGVFGLLVLAPYLALNYASFGHLMPISGAIKNAASQGIGFHWDGVSPMGRLFVVCAALALIFSFRREMPRPLKALLAGLATGYFVLIAYILFLTKHHTDWPWYYVSGAVVSAMVMPFIVDLVAKIRWFGWLTSNRMTLLCLTICIALNVYASARFSFPGLVYGEGTLRDRLDYTNRWQEEVGIWLRQNLPAESRLMVYDWPGTIAYASERSTLAPDGLINDFAYNDDILRESIAPYLKKRGIEYWLGPCEADATADQYWYDVRDADGFQDVEIMAPLYIKSAGTFRVQEADQVVRFRDVIFNPELPDIALWRISDQH